MIGLDIETDTTVDGLDPQTFYVLKILDNGMTIMVPIDNADAIGMRDIIAAEHVEKIYDILRDRETPTDNQTWNRRYREYINKIRTGDPIEVGAIRAVYGHDRTEPLRMGSVKSQIGHLETAAGVAGLVKLALAIEHGQVPGTLHLDELNPALPLDFPVHIPRRIEPWAEGPRRAAISSFGIVSFKATRSAHGVIEQ